VNRLYLHIAASVLGASLVGVLVFDMLLHPLLRQEERQGPPALSAQAQELVQALEQAPQARWAALAQRACQQQNIGLRVFAQGAPRSKAPSRLGCLKGPPPPGGPRLVPIRGGAFVVEVSESSPPPFSILPPIVLMTLLVVLSSVLVGWPLIRRLRKLEQAIDELGSGNLEVRLDDRSGALGHIARHLNDSAASLRTMFAEREELLQAVSHELGTPISRIKFQLELVREHSQAPEVHARLDAIDDDLEDMRQLSRELVSWLDAGRESLRHEQFEANEVVMTLTELVTEFPSRELEVELALCEEPLHIRAEARLFQRAIENLLTNAVRYTGTTVRVSTLREGDEVVIHVEDDGPGIPASERRRIFEPFVRLESSRSRDFGGIGLGMAITARIVKAHGASIHIDDSALGGARVTTRWRVHPPEG
jgi:signal transduction histidine kinase